MESNKVEIEVPEPILDAVRKAVEEHPADLQQAIVCAEQKVRRLLNDECKDFVTKLPLFLAKQLVYQCRHILTVAAKHRTYIEKSQPIVKPEESPGIRDAYAHLWNIFTCGKQLLNVRGDELKDFADTEQSLGEGHLLNARILRRLQPLVKGERTVHEAVKMKKIAQIIREEQRKVRKVAVA